jgi:hypothetical protein
MTPLPSRRGSRDPNYVEPAGSIWIHSHRDQLPDQEWVAANGSGIVVQDPSFDDLMRKLKDRRVDPSKVVIAFISSEPL